jgi:hypothetical protein
VPWGHVEVVATKQLSAGCSTMPSLRVDIDSPTMRNPTPNHVSAVAQVHPVLLELRVYSPAQSRRDLIVANWPHTFAVSTEAAWPSLAPGEVGRCQMTSTELASAIRAAAAVCSVV